MISIVTSVKVPARPQSNGVVVLELPEMSLVPETQIVSFRFIIMVLDCKWEMKNNCCFVKSIA